MARKTPLKTNPCLELIEPMVSTFLKKEKTRLFDALMELVQRNANLGGNALGFYYKGKVFSVFALRTIKGQGLEPVHQSLMPDAEDLDLVRVKLEHDEHKLINGLTVVLSRCNSFQDVRDVLPEPLAQVFSQLSCLTRIRDEGWVLKENPMLRNQYDKAIAIALYYQVNNLIF